MSRNHARYPEAQGNTLRDRRMFMEDSKLVYLSADSLRYMAGALYRGIGQDDDKFFPTLPGSQICGPSDRAADSLSHGMKTLVTGLMAIVVIKRLEKINIAENQRQGLLAANSLFRPTASDPDGQALVFSIRNLPAWAAFDTATGALTGTPATGAAGTYPDIVISVSDGLASASLSAFSVTVISTNVAPVIGGTPAATATVGQLYTFTPSASDKDGQKLSFSISGRPAWATFDSVTGKLTGTPTSSNIGTASGIVISVSDGQASSSLGPFSIAVRSGTPGSAPLSWPPPTQNVDGTSVTDLAGYRIAYGQSATNLSLSLDIPNPAITSAMLENLAEYIGSMEGTLWACPWASLTVAPCGGKPGRS